MVMRARSVCFVKGCNAFGCCGASLTVRSVESWLWILSHLSVVCRLESKHFTWEARRSFKGDWLPL